MVARAPKKMMADINQAMTQRRFQMVVRDDASSELSEWYTGRACSYGSPKDFIPVAGGPRPVAVWVLKSAYPERFGPR